MFDVSILSRFMSQPNKVHLGAVKHVLRYISRTTKYGVQYDKGLSCNLQGFNDSDWGSSLIYRKSTTGVVFNLG